MTVDRASRAPLVALALTLILAWPNFLFTTKWSGLPGALNGWRRPFYAAALVAVTALLFADRRRVGMRATPGRAVMWLVLAGGAAALAGGFLSRLPLSTWSEIPLKDDWTPLYQSAVNGVHLLRRGSVVGWNWWLQEGYPTSTDMAQNFAVLAFVPMGLFGERVGYHVLHAVMFLSLPAFVWWDLAQEDRDTGLLAAGFACALVAGFYVSLGNSGDTNSLAGVFSAAIALAGDRAARLGRRWGGPLLLAGLCLCLYSHMAFFIYAMIFGLFGAWYFRDPAAAIRLVLAGLIAGIVAVPAHWESVRYSSFVSFNNTVFDPAAPTEWGSMLRGLYYNVEILALPHRWFNDYRSINNVWLPALVVFAWRGPRSRAAYYAGATVLAQALLRLNTTEGGAIFDRIQHTLPIVAAPALAGVVMHLSGTRRLAVALTALVALYAATSFEPIRHVPDLRAWDPPLMDRIAASDGMVLVEISPHRDMDRDSARHSVRTPFDAHFEALLPGLAGQRFYSQMIDGWVWNVWRGDVVAAGTFRGDPIAMTSYHAFSAEMRKWGVRHLFVWTDEARSDLANSPQFAQRWSGGRWSHFEFLGADPRQVVAAAGQARLTNLDFLGGDVELTDAVAGSEIVLRSHAYPAWRAYDGTTEIALYDEGGQLALRAPRSGSYVVKLVYPRYHGLAAIALAALAIGAAVLWQWPRRESGA